MKRFTICLLFLAIAGLGCQLSLPPLFTLASPTPTQTPTPAPTRTPTATPTPLPTPTPGPSARLGVGEQLLFIGSYDQALQDYQTAFDQAPDDNVRAVALVGIGRTQYLKRNYPAALTALNDAIEKYPKSSALATAYYYRAQLDEINKQYTQAANDYAAYVQQHPGILDAYMQEARGDNLVQAGDYPGAISSYEAAASASRLTDPVFVRIKVARAYASQGDNSTAIRQYLQIFDASNNDYVKAQMDWLAGQIYLKMGLPEQAYARFQDAVNNYPRPYDSYSSLSALLDAGIEVNPVSRGLVDYYAGQYGMAIDVFTRYLDSTPQHDGTAHYYKALSLREQNNPAAAAAELDLLIKDHPGDPFYVDAYREKAYTQWAYLDRYDYAAETLLGFVRLYPTDPSAAGFLFEAGRIYERNNRLSEAANTWGRLMNEYPSAEVSYRGLFLSAITRYRLQDYTQALTIFQRSLLLGTNPTEQSQSYFWVGKTAQALGKPDVAQQAFEQGAQQDPTGYYSERALSMLKGRPVMTASNDYDLGYDLDRERADAETWMRKTFNLQPNADLAGLSDHGSDPRVLRGDAYWQLGLYSQARNEFDSLRKDLTSDAVGTYRFMNHVLDLGLYQQAVLSARQVLSLAILDDAASLNAPVYFNHIRFGTYFKDLVLPAAQQENINPLLLFSVIRQESLFEGFSLSSAGARGLMQIMPPTGKEISDTMHWPPDYTDDDLERPAVNITLGTRYLSRQRDYFDGDLYAALAGYNGGPGNSQVWKNLSNDDPDLFLEIIRIDESRTYVMQIADFLNIYNRLYTRTP
jgi:soluble lytic murein transglycosylase